MSPSSAGTSLEIEKYIGSYLISSASRSKHKGKTNFVREPETAFSIQQRQRNSTHYMPNNEYHQKRYGSKNHTDVWAGGIPLISTASNNTNTNNYQRRSTKKDIQPPTSNTFYQQNQLSRLAIHTTGTPLILSGRYRNKKNVSQKPKQEPHAEEIPDILIRTKSDSSESAIPASKPVDTLSVASDESSGSANSENCLPRIIKPRKRRKKDRKPVADTLQVPRNKSDTPTSDTVTPLSNTSPSFRSNNIVTMRPYAPFEPDSENIDVLVKALNSCADISEIPKLSHSFEDVKGCDDLYAQCSPISCQCKVCDPAGQIWDIHSSGTPYSFRLMKSASQDSGYTTSFDDRVDTIALRRSWSDPINYPNFGAIGAGRKIHAPAATEAPVNLAQILDISTEIVTSLNGHRDLEIKFFSSVQRPFPTSSNVSGDNCDNGAPPDCGESGANLERDCDISYGTVDISTLLVDAEE